MIDSQPASCPAQTCNEPTDEIRFRAFPTGGGGVVESPPPAKYLLILPTWKPPPPSRPSLHQIFHPSVPSTDGPASALVLTAALFTKSALIASNFIGRTCSGVSVSKNPNLLLYHVDVFALTGSRFFDLME